MIRFTLADLHATGLNCGPASLAAICGLTLDEVRVRFPGFRGWCNPTMMIEAVKRVRPSDALRVINRRGASWPRYGIARIQFEGPWTAPGANPRWAYRHTHWVGARRCRHHVQCEVVDIWDVNALQDQCDGWLAQDAWSASIVPALTADIPRATGGWHVTHAIEVSR